MSSTPEPALLAMSVLASVVNVVLVGLLWAVLLRRPVHVDRVGNVTLNLVVVAVMPYSVVVLLFVFNWAATGEAVLRGAVCQASGVFVMLSLLLPPTAVVIRYTYFLWYVVLQRRISAWRWLLGSGVGVGLVVVLAVVPGVFGEYRARDELMQCTILYHTQAFWPKFFGGVLALVILAGLLAHVAFNIFILSKLKRLSQLLRAPRAEPTQTSRDALLRRFFPVALAYILTHCAPLVLALVELITQAPASLGLLRFYSVSYAITTVVGPLATIIANKSLVQDIKTLFQ